jgi:hypothetical protein
LSASRIGAGTVAQVSDSAAPRLTVSVPDAMTGAVTIAAAKTSLMQQDFAVVIP